jgi:hypothetical protein
MTGPSRRGVTERVRDRLLPHAQAEPGVDVDRILLAIGRMESRRVRSERYENLADAEFRIFSQFGEDGIIQYLVGKVPIEQETFVEFGVQDYRESNTRFLVWNDNWRGLILDGGTAHVEYVRSDPVGWRHWVDARSVFVTRDNINAEIAAAGISGDIGLLSVDIDGNDYWVLDAIDVVRPRILIVEYNSTFGPEAAVTIPYDPAFDRTRAHSSNLYWGASLAAVAMAADRKGLSLVGSNSAGNNAFFVREDLLGELRPLQPSDAWVDARFRESRDEAGNLTFIAGREGRLAAIADLPLVDVRTGTKTSVGSCK